MSTLFGSIGQIGYVVEDLDKALDHWTRTLRVGPFFRLDRLRFDHFEYRGEASPFEVAVAVGYSGPMQIELVQPLNDAPSPYGDHLERHGFGQHHLGIFAADFDGMCAMAEAAGFTPLVEAKVLNGPRFQYLDCAALPGTMIEIAETVPKMLEGAKRMEAEAARWTGEDPVRPFSASVRTLA